jgi:hypothetical protein
VLDAEAMMEMWIGHKEILRNDRKTRFERDEISVCWGRFSYADWKFSIESLAIVGFSATQIDSACSLLAQA